MRIQFAITARKFMLVVLALGSCPCVAAPQQTLSGEADTTTIEIQIDRRQVVGDKVIRVTRDQEVTLVWTTDEAAELHIHGYDIRFEISPDAPTKVAFAAHATGRFAVTSHGFGDEHSHGHKSLLYIEVYPK